MRVGFNTKLTLSFWKTSGISKLKSVPLSIEELPSFNVTFMLFRVLVVVDAHEENVARIVGHGLWVVLQHGVVRSCFTGGTSLSRG